MHMQLWMVMRRAPDLLPSIRVVVARIDGATDTRCLELLAHAFDTGRECSDICPTLLGDAGDHEDDLG